MQEELKPLPCPFCQSTGMITIFSGNGGYGNCANCDADGPWTEGSEDDIIAAWNRRTPVSGEGGSIKIEDEGQTLTITSPYLEPGQAYIITKAQGAAAMGIDHAKLEGERAAFEGWYTQNYTDWIPRSLLDAEEYGNLDTQLAWKAWQARGQQAGGAEAPTIEHIDKAIAQAEIYGHKDLADDLIKWKEATKNAR